MSVTKIKVQCTPMDRIRSMSTCPSLFALVEGLPEGPLRRKPHNVAAVEGARESRLRSERTVDDLSAIFT